MGLFAPKRDPKLEFDQDVFRSAESTKAYLTPLLDTSDKIIGQGVILDYALGILSDDRGDLLPGWAYVTTNRMIYNFDVFADFSDPYSFHLDSIGAVRTTPWTLLNGVSHMEYQLVVVAGPPDPHVFLVLKNSNIPIALENCSAFSAEEEDDGEELPVQTTSPRRPDLVEQLLKLGELRASGILTEAEFVAAKAELIGRLNY